MVENTQSGLQSCLRGVELVAKNALQFLHHETRDQRNMFAHHNLEKIGAETSADERADQDVGVENNPHGTSRKTSSSVNQPCASASGTSCSLTSSRAEIASCRRSASRTTSLRVRPEPVAARSSDSESWSSRRIVSVVLMYDNVVRRFVICKTETYRFPDFGFRISNLPPTLPAGGFAFGIPCSRFQPAREGINHALFRPFYPFGVAGWPECCRRQG